MRRTSIQPKSPWRELLGSRSAHRFFSSIAPGLSSESQQHSLFANYALNPELFARRLEHLAPGERRRITSALAIAHDYAVFRERAFQERPKQPFDPSAANELLKTLPEEARLESREWIGFWAQFRQGHWSSLEWVERGVRTHVNFDAGEFFGRLLSLHPRAFVLVHNHPSGVTTPSWVDYRLTERIRTIARQFGIELRGHWIVGPHSEDWIAPGLHRMEAGFDIEGEDREA